MFRIIESNVFRKRRKRLTTKDQTALKKIIYTLKFGKLIGKPLNYKFFREIKIRKKRIYFLVYDDLKAILLVSISDKKTQQHTINEIRSMIPEYKIYIYKIITQ